MRRFVSIREFGFALVMLALGILGRAQEARSEKQHTLPPLTKSQVEEPAGITAARTEADRPSVERPPSVPAIGAGDLLKVSVLGAPESDQEVRVGADGNIFLNLEGSVHVAGLTTEQAQATIAKKMVAGGFFTDPQVSVFAKEYATQGVSVLGEVQKPGVYPLLGARTLFDVLSLAGGTTPKAGQVISITHRDHPQAPTNVLMTNNTAQSLQSNVDIFPGDTIVVSKAGIVYVVGDVRRPSGVMMENGTQMTVLQAIAMAEGTAPTASLNGAKIIRKTPKGPQEMPLELKKILAAKSPDIQLQADDIIFVPGSAAKGAAKRGLEAIIQAATGLAIYRPY
jgi:polysaccharide export outer membrane protein